MTSAMRRSRTVFAAVSTALRAAASHDSLLTPITSVTRYTPSAITTVLSLDVGGLTLACPPPADNPARGADEPNSSTPVSSPRRYGGHELREADHVLVDSGQPPVTEGIRQLVAAEDPHSGRRAHDRAAHRGWDWAAMAARQQGDPTAGSNNASDLVERPHRLLDQVQRSKAADRVETAVPERQRAGIAAHIGDIGTLGLPHRNGQHRARRIESHHEARVRDAGELAREIAGPAGDVQHPAARREGQHPQRDFALRVH